MISRRYFGLAGLFAGLPSLRDEVKGSDSKLASPPTGAIAVKSIAAPPPISLIDDAAKVIFTLPEWPESGTLQRKDWRKVLRFAMQIRTYGQEGAVLTFASYWRQVLKGGNPSDDEAVGNPSNPGDQGPSQVSASPTTRLERAFSKCMLINRVLFDIPKHDIQPELEGLGVWMPTACGGIPFTPLAGTDAKLADWIGSPVGWNGLSPVLLAVPDLVPKPGFSRGFVNEPHIELSIFWQAFPIRPNLKEILGSMGG